jgi:hypothetical protein
VLYSSSLRAATSAVEAEVCITTAEEDDDKQVDAAISHALAQGDEYPLTAN